MQKCFVLRSECCFGKSEEREHLSFRQTKIVAESHLEEGGEGGLATRALTHGRHSNIKILDVLRVELEIGRLQEKNV